VTADGVQQYIDNIDAKNRPLFDRLHRLILEVHPEAMVVLSYNMPSYEVGARRVHVGVWKHGLSIYGWQSAHDDAFLARHPELKTSTGTLRLRPKDAADITDDELRALARGALDS
jgi:uncharacterized protein YdhG (YjbR/CyaY superfamily)